MTKVQLSYDDLKLNVGKLREIAEQVEEDNNRVVEIFNTMNENGYFNTENASQTVYKKVMNIAKDIRQYLAKLTVYEQFLDGVIQETAETETATTNIWENLWNPGK